MINGCARELKIFAAIANSDTNRYNTGNVT